MHETKPLVSVIMNCHNGEKYLEQSIKSIISQTYKNWELIFWDNVSFFKEETRYCKERKLKISNN